MPAERPLHPLDGLSSEQIRLKLEEQDKELHATVDRLMIAAQDVKKERDHLVREIRRVRAALADALIAVGESL